MANIFAPYPLGSVSNADLVSLVQTLWRWELCNSCQAEPGRRPCTQLPCSGRRWARMDIFFGFYKRITAAYVPDMLAGSPPALKTHQDLLAIVQLLKMHPQQPRAALVAAHFHTRSGHPPPTVDDQNRAFNLAMRVMTTLACCTDYRSVDGLEANLHPVVWRADMSLSQLLSVALPLSAEDEDGLIKYNLANELINARNLVKTPRLRFLPTDELSEHLNLDKKQGTVSIYRHTAFLKETLIASNAAGSTCNIPRAFAIEILDSIQKTLFPSSEDAQSLLRSLVAQHGLDPDCRTYEPSSYQLDGEGQFGYRYLKPRIMELYHEIQRPTARGYFEKLMERKSGARYVMMATLTGVVIAIILGALALGVSIFQAWVGYQQWKHPVSP